MAWGLQDWGGIIFIVLVWLENGAGVYFEKDQAIRRMSILLFGGIERGGKLGQSSLICCGKNIRKLRKISPRVKIGWTRHGEKKGNYTLLM